MECIGISEFTSNLLKLADGELVLGATLELTLRCPLGCGHCYCAGSKYHELSTDEWKGIANRCTQGGCILVVLTGGEPLMRDDFEEIYLHLKQNGTLIGVLTNAVFLTKRHFEMFAEYPPLGLDISIYGSSEKVYDRVTQTRGFFPKFVRNLDELKNRGIPFSLKTMILKENHEDIPAIAKMAKDYDVSFRTDPVIMPRRNKDCSSYFHAVKPALAAKFERMSPKRKDQIDKFFAGTQPQSGASKEKRAFTCIVEKCKSSVFVNANGGISPCLGLAEFGVKYDKCSSLRGGLDLFWGTIQNRFSSVHNERIEKCFNCKYISICPYCAAWDLGNGESQSPWNCAEWMNFNLEREKLALAAKSWEASK